MRSVDSSGARAGRLLLGIAAALVLLTASGYARAARDVRVVPGVAIDAVRLGSTVTAVRARIGTPLSTRRLRGALGTPELVMRYPTLVATFARTNGAYRVITISTANRRARLRNGVGVGTGVGTLKRQVAGVRCGLAVCRLGRTRPAGGRLTTFFLKEGRVQKIAVALGVNA